MSMRKYTPVRPKDWMNDHYQSIYRDAGPTGFYLWMYLISGPLTDSRGLYRLHPSAVADDLDLEVEDVEDALIKLEKKYYLSWDFDNDVILLHGEFLRQTPVKGSNLLYPQDKRIAGARSHAMDYEHSYLSDMFLKALDEMVSNTRNTETETETETDREHHENAPSKPLLSPLNSGLAKSGVKS